ncbi:outer membrane beta-barrel protein, partial [Acinetobacter baumannii]|nr:outer membrane beta-barrel protein [Acinetobacter baumannii]
MASVRLPWNMTFQATGRYNSRRITAQGTLEPDWDVEAGVRKNIGSWGISLLCKDIFNSKETNNVLYGN